MRIRRVEIERFLGVQESPPRHDDELQLVAGPNHAGKSPLVRLLEVFFSASEREQLVELLPLNDYYGALGPRTLSSIQVWFDRFHEDDARSSTPSSGQTTA